MKTQNTFYIYELTCNNCAAKVKAALLSHVGGVEISADFKKITIQNNQLTIEKLNKILSKIGQYYIGDAVSNAPITAENTIKSDKNTTQSDNFGLRYVNQIAVYKPLLLVFAYILLVCFCIEIVNEGFVLHRFMPNFMAGFFLVFSFFKLLDLNGFASSYAMYDVIAKRIPIYGFIYPCIEAGLAAAYLLAPSHVATSSITLIVMLISLIGVVQAVLSRQKIQCACLGTGFNLPMSTVTIIEDTLMAAMAAWMLI